MKRKRTDFEVVLQDGSIKLAPGAWVCFHVDTPFEPNSHQLNEWLRRMRGAVLSDVFGIENDLILLKLADEFGTVDHGKATRAYFDRDQELREDHSLERKIHNVKAVIRRLFGRAEADRLIQDLATCREVRNLMAHYPSWQVPINDENKERTIGLKLFIGDKSHVWELDEADFASWGKLFVHVRRQLIRLRHRLTGDPEPEWADDNTFVIKPSA